MYYVVVYNYEQNQYARFAVKADSQSLANERALKSVGIDGWRVEKSVHLANISYTLEL